MNQYNYPTTILLGKGALKEAVLRIEAAGIKKPLLVTDKTLVKIGIAGRVLEFFKKTNIKPVVFDECHPNPIEDDVLAGADVYTQNKCDAVIGLGGGSPMDLAKTIAIKATQPGELEIFDDTKGGDKHIVNPLPPIYAIPTTAGTGSEVGCASVVILKKSNLKTIFFHPDLLPKLAILEPELTADLPANVTAATGIDAFTHSLEAYLAPGFNPMADGIALQSIELILDNLSVVYSNGKDLLAREKMLMASSMGAIAFQKGLGMIHSIAHPLSSECGLHHGLANALVGPRCVQFLENSTLLDDQKRRLNVVSNLFKERDLFSESLSHSMQIYFESLGVKFGLKNHGVKEDQVEVLSEKAFGDPCHQTNMIPVSQEQFKAVILEAL